MTGDCVSEWEHGEKPLDEEATKLLRETVGERTAAGFESGGRERMLPSARSDRRGVVAQ